MLSGKRFFKAGTHSFRLEEPTLSDIVVQFCDIRGKLSIGGTDDPVFVHFLWKNSQSAHNINSIHIYQDFTIESVNTFLNSIISIDTS